MADKNIEGVLKLFYQPSQDNYREIYTFLKSKDKLSAHVSGMGESDVRKRFRA